MLKQYVYTDLFALLVKNYFGSQATTSTAPSSTTELRSDLEVMRQMPYAMPVGMLQGQFFVSIK